MPIVAAGQKNTLVNVVINGVPIAQPAMAKTGGDLTVSATKVYPGGMAEQVSIGGTTERTDASLTFLYTDYIRGMHKTIDSAAQAGDCPISFTENDMGSQKQLLGTSRGVTGTVTEVKGPEYSSSSNDAKTLEITVACDSQLV